MLLLILPSVCEYATTATLRQLHQALGGDAGFARWSGLGGSSSSSSGGGGGGGDDDDDDDERGMAAETALERLAYRRLAPALLQGRPSAAAAVCLWPSRRLLLLDRQGYAWVGGLAIELPSDGRTGGADEAWMPLPLRPLRRPQRRFLQVAAAGERRWLLLDLRGRVWLVKEGDDEAVELRSLGERLGRVRCLAGTVSHVLYCTAEGEVWEQTTVEDRSDLATDMRRLTGLPPVVQVAAGRHSSFMVDHHGQLWGCGSNSFTQLGIGSDLTEVHDPVPVPVPPSAGPLRRVCCASGKLMTLHENGDACCAGWCSPTQTSVLMPWLMGVSDLSLSDCHFLVQRTDGTFESGGVFPEDGKMGRTVTTSIFQPLAPLDRPLRQAVACTVHIPQALTLLFEEDDDEVLPSMVGCGQFDPLPLLRAASNPAFFFDPLGEKRGIE